MDNKVTKQRVNDHLEYDWFKYVIILILCIVVGYFIFSQIQSNKDYETVDIFVTAYSSQTNEYADNIFKEMGAAAYTQKDEGGVSLADTYGENVLRNINFNVRSPLEKEYGQLLQTQGMVSSDLLILGKTQTTYNASGFVLLTDELLTEYLLPKGLKIDDLEYLWADSSEFLLDGNGEKIPDLDENGEQKKDDYNNLLFKMVQVRKGIRVDTFSKMSGTGSVFETDWRNIKDLNDTYKDKEEAEQPDRTFYMVINPQSVSIGRFGKKAKPQNAQALYCMNRFIQYYR